MTLASFLGTLGAPVQDVEEETFELFAQDPPSQNLGFIDSRATSLELTVAGRDFTIHQSPSVLSSNRAGGTTGAVVWKITPLFAEWLAPAQAQSQNQAPTNPLFAHGVLTPSSLVLELGSGTSALVGLLLAPRVARYVLTDQAYVAKLVEQNLAENRSAAAAAAAPTPAKTAARRSRASTPAAASTRRRRASPASTSTAGRRDAAAAAGDGAAPNLHFTPLDWETDEVTPALTGPGSEAKSFDVVLACDCIYNEALVEPFVTTCVDLCRLRAAEADEAEAEAGHVAEPTVCVVAQHLRDPLVFEAWATRFTASFHTWRVPDGMLVPGLRSNSGFVVHVGVLKGGINLEVV